MGYGASVVNTAQTPIPLSGSGPKLEAGLEHIRDSKGVALDSKRSSSCEISSSGSVSRGDTEYYDVGDFLSHDIFDTSN